MQLESFQNRFPDRVDDRLRETIAHVGVAFSTLDSSFYAEGNADPNYDEEDE